MMLLNVTSLVLALSAEAPQPSATPTTRSVVEAIGRPWGKLFWIERVNGRYRTGDPASRYSVDRDFEHLTFDISNNKVLANVGVQGALESLTIYRGSYGVTGTPQSLPGVWMAKDNSTFGPYSYTLHLQGEAYDLARVDWDFRTGLLDNVFPVTELRDPQGRVLVRLLTYAPVSADGSQRVRAAVYGIELENRSPGRLEGTIELPGTFANQRQDFLKHPIHMWEPFEFEFGRGDSGPFLREVPFRLGPGERLWLPTVLYMPGDPALEEVNAKGTVAWLRESGAYYRRVLGRLETTGDLYLAEFFERQALQALQSIAMSPDGALAGTNWGSYPATREIWMKDAYYCCLPTVEMDPSLALPIIRWFDAHGVRPRGTLVEGGLNHSLSLSVASVVLGGSYYETTGDRAFFAAHPELRRSWDALLDGVIASRTGDGPWLFRSRYISDGALEGAYSTGSNVVAWRALVAWSRLLREVFADAPRARRYAEVAEKVRAAILSTTVIDGPFGRQFIEGVDESGKPPRMVSDGEESDTTLMPFYGFLPDDDETYLHSMRFAMSEHNEAYQPKVRAITWAGRPETPLADRVPSTAPGYMKGIALGRTKEDLFGEHGYYTEVRRVTDADGSVFWWPYGWNSNPPTWDYDRPVRMAVPGKSGWFAGVHTAVFVSRYLGVSYDGPAGVLRFAPSPLVADRFRWSDLPIGNQQFTVSYEREGTVVRVSASGRSSRATRLEATLPVDGLGGTVAVTVDGRKPLESTRVLYLGRESVKVVAEIPPGGSVTVVASGQ